MYKLFYKRILICILLFSFHLTFAQKSNRSQNVIVKMKNEKEYKGNILENNEKTILLKDSYGKIALPISSIDTIEDDDYQGKHNFDNPIPSKYFITGSAIPIKKGEGYYNNTFLSVNSINYGLTDYVSVGGGFELISLLGGTPIWFVNSKMGSFFTSSGVL